MLLETAIGSGAALLVFQAWQGFNVLPVVGLLFYLLERRGELIPNRFETCALQTWVTFDDVGGQGTAKQELQEALDFILQAEAHESPGR